MSYPNEALTEICRQLLDEWELTPQQIENLAADIAGECKNMTDNRDEADYVAHQQSLMESGGRDDGRFRKIMADAGRSHLLK